MVLFANLPRTIVACDFSRVHSNSKEVSYLTWQSKYSNLKTTCHIKAKFFVWTKHVKKLLSAKFLISSRTVYQYSWIFWKQYFIELKKVARIYSHVSYITKSCTCHWWLYLEIAFNWIIWSCTTMSF